MNQMINDGISVEFDVPGITLAGKRWHQGGIPTLALHGWLDNANTFDRLAPLLPELDIVALDFAGHGRSEHRHPGAHYHPLFDIQEVLAVANQLGWDEFNLVGHSMGAGISTELSCLFPERVNKAVMVDGFLATGGMPIESRREQNRDAILRMLAPSSNRLRVFSDLEEMAVRVTEATDQSIEAARSLVARGHKPVEGGVTWRTDPRIRFPTPLRQTREQVDMLLQHCDVDCLLIVAEQGDNWYQGEIQDAEAHHPRLTIKRMPGPHHIHLEPAYVDTVSQFTRDFLGLG